MSEDDVPGVGDYEGAAAGWGALKAVADAVRGQMAVVKETRGLLNMNQPHGFDCPGCAWPDPKHTSSFEFCENGAKAVAWEATAKRTTPEVFASHTVSELWNWPDFDLENEPAALARTGAVHVTAAPYRDVDAGFDADRVHLLSGKGRPRYRGAEGNHEDPHGTRCKKPGRRRLRRSRP